MLYLSCQEILFFNHVQTEKRKASQRFPSPVGESYFSIMVNFYMMVYEHSFHPLSGNLIFQSIECDCNGFQFPPPVGESYFSMIFLPRVQWQWLPVSAPCRGILFFNYMIFASESDYIVSVPCRGILFFNLLFIRFLNL